MDGHGVTVALTSSKGGADDNDAQGGKLVAMEVDEPREMASTLDKITQQALPNQALSREMPAVVGIIPMVGGGSVRDGGTETSPTLASGGHTRGVNPSIIGIDAAPRGFDDYNQADTGEVSQTLTKGGKPATWTPGDLVVRRLTPVECLRLQGMADDHCGVPNEPPDTPVYAGCGDAITSNVAEWIGRRILAYGR